MLLLGESVPQNCRKTLTESGYAFEILPPWNALPKPIRTHPDMLVYQLRDGLLLAGDYYRENKQFFDKLSVSLTVDESIHGGEYPWHCALNALRMGTTVFGNAKALSAYIVKDAENLKNVRQGYANCSTCAVCENAAITADCGMAHAMSKNAIDVMLISSGNILLPGYDTGFIGGAALTLSYDTIAFFGNPMRHPDGQKIIAYIESRGKKVFSLSDDILLDCGGAILL